MSGPEQAATVTPGQAVHDAWWHAANLDTHPEYLPWEQMPAPQREHWEAAAAPLRRERDDARAVVRDMLLAVTEYAGSEQDSDLIAKWRERAGLEG